MQKLPDVASRVKDVIDHLGKLSPDDIAETLKKHGVRGRRQFINACPIANYIRQEAALKPEPYAEVEVLSRFIRVEDRDRYNNEDEGITVTSQVYITIDLPETVQSFIKKFDAGDYPELIDR